MSILDSAPHYCPNCDNKLSLDITPSTENGVDGVKLAVYCHSCNYWESLGFEENSDDDDESDDDESGDDESGDDKSGDDKSDDDESDDDESDDDESDDDESDDDESDDDESDDDESDDDESDDVISLLFPNNSQEEALDEIFDMTCK